MSAVKPLPTTAWAVLGLLSFGRPLAGYELRQWSLQSLDHLWTTPAQSQIYRELKRLEGLGYLTSVVIAGVDAPDKRVYEPTREGIEALRGWLADAAAEAPTLKHGPALRTFLGHLGKPDDLVRMMDAHIARVENTLDDLEGLAVGLDGDPDADLTRAAIDWALEIHRGDLSGALAVRDRLDAVAARP